MKANYHKKSVKIGESYSFLLFLFKTANAGQSARRWRFSFDTIDYSNLRFFSAISSHNFIRISTAHRRKFIALKPQIPILPIDPDGIAVSHAAHVLGDPIIKMIVTVPCPFPAGLAPEQRPYLQIQSRPARRESPPFPHSESPVGALIAGSSGCLRRKQ